MLTRRDDVKSDTVDIIGVETTMSPDIIGSTVIVRSPDIEMTIMPPKENLGSNMCITTRSAPSYDPPGKGV